MRRSPIFHVQIMLYRMDRQVNRRTWPRFVTFMVLSLSATCIGRIVGSARAANADDKSAAVRIDADFPGGNILLDRTDGNDVFLHQDLRDTEGQWFYWCFRVRGALAGRSLTFHFTKGDVIGVRGPAVSTDGGVTWTWLGRETVHGAAFTYAFVADAEDVRFSMTVPYVQADLRRFLDAHKHADALKVETLCKTPKGREAELLRVGRLDDEADGAPRGADRSAIARTRPAAAAPPLRVVLTARHHACESMASFELEGIIDGILGDDDNGRWLREHVAFFIVPFVDKDGVEDGDQGKNRKPHDHNRDYDADPPLYPTVAAIKQRVPQWSHGRVDIAMDLHCPALKGALHEVIHFVGGPDADNEARVARFSKLLEESTRDGPLAFRARDNLPYGKDWNTLKEPKSFGRWASGPPGPHLATTLELPYANARGQTVTPDSARAFGRAIAGTMVQYLQSPGDAEKGATQ